MELEISIIRPHKVDVPYSVTNCIRTPIFEWYVVLCGSENKYKKDMCLKEIRLRAQNMLIILDLTINIIRGDLYNHLMSTKKPSFS